LQVDEEASKTIILQLLGKLETKVEEQFFTSVLAKKRGKNIRHKN